MNLKTENGYTFDLMTPVRLAQIWRGMNDRCYKPLNGSYANYGGRGITVWKAWRESFETFFTWAIENGYQHNLSVGRIDNDKGYSPSNCRWETKRQQANNHRRNVLLTAFGETKTVTQWTRDARCSVKANTLKKRLTDGWTVTDAITKPKVYADSRKRRSYPTHPAFGERKCYADWARDPRCRVCKGTLVCRVFRGWDLERAIVTPNL